VQRKVLLARGVAHVVTVIVRTEDASRLTSSKNRFVSREQKAGQSYCIQVEGRSL